MFSSAFLFNLSSFNIKETKTSIQHRNSLQEVYKSHKNIGLEEGGKNLNIIFLQGNLTTNLTGFPSTIFFLNFTDGILFWWFFSNATKKNGPRLLQWGHYTFISFLMYIHVDQPFVNIFMYTNASLIDRCRTNKGPSKLVPWISIEQICKSDGGDYQEITFFLQVDWPYLEQTYNRK